MKRSWKGLIVALALAQAVSGCVLGQNGLFDDCSRLSGGERDACQLTNTINLLFALGLAGLVGSLVASHQRQHHSSPVPGNVSTPGTVSIPGGISCTPNC